MYVGNQKHVYQWTMQGNTLLYRKFYNHDCSQFVLLESSQLLFEHFSKRNIIVGKRKRHDGLTVTMSISFCILWIPLCNVVLLKCLTKIKLTSPPP